MPDLSWTPPNYTVDREGRIVGRKPPSGPHNWGSLGREGRTWDRESARSGRRRAGRAAHPYGTGLQPRAAARRPRSRAPGTFGHRAPLRLRGFGLHRRQRDQSALPGLSRLRRLPIHAAPGQHAVGRPRALRVRGRHLQRLLGRHGRELRRCAARLDSPPQRHDGRTRGPARRRPHARRRPPAARARHHRRRADGVRPPPRRNGRAGRHAARADRSPSKSRYVSIIRFTYGFSATSG